MTPEAPAEAPAPAPRLVVSGGTVHETPSRTSVHDLHVSGRVVSGPVGSEARAPSPDAGDVVIDATGASVVPLLTASVGAHGPDGLRPGGEATFAVIRGRVGADRIRRLLVVAPRDLVALVVEGRLCARDGVPLLAAGTGGSASAGERWCGAWRDPGAGLVQHLLPDGRYTETRNGVVDAYTGTYWTVADRVLYLDDSGFWAHGQLVDDVLHHAGFVMRR